MTEGKEGEIKISGAYDVCDIVGHLKFAICTGSLRMDDSLGNSFAVEVGEEIDEMEILQQKRPISPYAI